MQKFIFVFLLLLLTIPSIGQALFEKYRFDDGGYILLGVFVHYSNHSLQKKIGEFYTDEVNVLKAIQKDWVFKKPQSKYACGYHYEIILLKNGKELDSFPINLECNELVTSKGSVYFDLRKLEDFAPRFKSLKEETRQFRNVEEARRSLSEISKRADFVYAQPPQWLSYEGTFQFEVQCPADLGEDCWTSSISDKLISRLRAEITKKYPGEVFELMTSGSTKGGIFVAVKCNKSLEEKFDLFDRRGKNLLGLGKWYPYQLSLTWFRKMP